MPDVDEKVGRLVVGDARNFNLGPDVVTAARDPAEDGDVVGVGGVELHVEGRCNEIYFFNTDHLVELKLVKLATVEVEYLS